MKKCTRCEAEKELTEFHKRKDRASGVNTICKGCLNSRRKQLIAPKKGEVNRKQREGYKKNREDRLKWMNEYWKNLPEEEKNRRREIKRIQFKTSQEQKANKKKYLKEVYDQEKLKANRELNEALRRDKIQKPDYCQICNEKKRLDGHHSDYSKPLQVLWVCRKCHSAIHKQLKERNHGSN